MCIRFCWFFGLQRELSTQLSDLTASLGASRQGHEQERSRLTREEEALTEAFQSKQQEMLKEFNIVKTQVRELREKVSAEEEKKGKTGQPKTNTMITI